MAWKALPETVTLTVQTPKPKAFALDPARTAVVIVDMQNTYVHTGDKRSLAILEGNVRLIAKARESGAKVIYVQSVRQLESPDHTVFGKPLHLLVGSWDVQIAEEIAPRPGEPVIQKWSTSCWAWHGMEALLAREGIIAGEWTVLVTGLSAAGCVQAAALGFSNRNYRTLMPLDCAAAADVESEARTYYQYMSDGYRHNMDFTLSTMVTFTPAGSRAAAERVAVSVP